MKEYVNIDYGQYEKNNKLSFALASMMFEDFTHIVVKRSIPGKGMQTLGGGHVATVLSRYGDLQIEKSMITHEGILQLIVL